MQLSACEQPVSGHKRRGRGRGRGGGEEGEEEGD